MPARKRSYRSRRKPTRAKSLRKSTGVKNPIMKKAVAKARRTQRKVNRKNKVTFKPSFIPASCIIKNNTLTGWDNQAVFGTAPAGGEAYDPKVWQIIRPLNLNRSATDYEGVARTTNAIWARNTKFDIEILPSKRCLGGFQFRMIYGYFKGDSNVATQGLTSDGLKTIYPHINSRLQDKEHAGKSDFYWKHKETHTIVPHQIFDENGSDDKTGDEVMVALYKPKTIYGNFHYNRKITYENSDGDSQNGWLPMIAFQCLPLPGHNGLTRPSVPSGADTGNNPCPRVSLRCSTYFSDIH